MKPSSLASQTRPFLDFLETWAAALPALPLNQAIPDPQKAAILSVDNIHGFCYEGALSSPRVAGFVAPVARLFERAWELGMRQIILTQDTHAPDAVEFALWPPHCVQSTCAWMPTLASFHTG